jgi:hypothetical protein
MEILRDHPPNPNASKFYLAHLHETFYIFSNAQELMVYLQVNEHLV